MPLLSRLAEATDERPGAIRVQDRSLSWVELRRAAAAVADDLRGATRVAVPATASLETVVGVVGGLLAGAAVVPVPPDAGPMERDHILRDSGAELLLAAPGTREADSPPLVPLDLARRSDTRHPEPDPAPPR